MVCQCLKIELNVTTCSRYPNCRCPHSDANALDIYYPDSHSAIAHTPDVHIAAFQMSILHMLVVQNDLSSFDLGFSLSCHQRSWSWTVRCCPLMDSVKCHRRKNVTEEWPWLERPWPEGPWLDSWESWQSLAGHCSDDWNYRDPGLAKVTAVHFPTLSSLQRLLLLTKVYAV